MLQPPARSGDAPPNAPADAATRRSIARDDGAKVWITSRPGGEICTVTAIPGRELGMTGCRPEREAASRPSVGGLVRVGGGTVTAGTVPDGVVSLSFALRGGKTLDVRPRDNAYLVETPADFTRVTATWADGRRTVALDADG